MEVDGERINLTTGFEDLHSRVYESILAGEGFGIQDARPAIELVHALRHAPVKRPAAGEPMHRLVRS
jgi:UDP-N-acetyl-2-amino-2-deoxyglucuronate dehydrogenase